MLHRGLRRYGPAIRPQLWANSRRGCNAPATVGRRSFASRPRSSNFGGGIPRVSPASGPSGPSPESRELLKPNNLFHPFSRSPSSAIRQRAAFIKQNAFCPHPSHQQTRLPVSPHDPETRKSAEHHSQQHQQPQQPPAHSHFECPDCGVPIYCDEGHWMDDFEAHLEICDTIRQINEDDHDLHSGRFFPEFSYPGVQDDTYVVNMTNWDTFMYTREFEAINSDRSMRQVTRMLTYPMTIGSVLHELSPYSVRKDGRLTVEGLKSLSGMYPASFWHNRKEKTDFESSAVYYTSPEVWRKHGYARPPSQGTTSPVVHSGSTSGIIASAGCVAAIEPYFPTLADPFDFHRAREHGQPRRGIPTPRANSWKPIWRDRGGPTRRTNENHYLR